MEPHIFRMLRMQYRWLNLLIYYPFIYLDILFFACSSYFYFSFMTKVILMSQEVS